MNQDVRSGLDHPRKRMIQDAVAFRLYR